jgi:hypothetical protein
MTAADVITLPVPAFRLAQQGFRVFPLRTEQAADKKGLATVGNVGHV